MVEPGELPTEALIREVKEEVNLHIAIKKIIHEYSNLDVDENIVFTCLVYMCEVVNNDISNIELQADEYDQYKLINSIKEMDEEELVDYVKDVIKYDLKMLGG